MRICTASLDVGYYDLGVPAGTRVVVPNDVAMTMRDAIDEAGKPPLRMSGMGHYTRHYCGQCLDGKRLLAYRGHGLGDQLVFGAVLRLLKQTYPSCQIVLPCRPIVRDLVWGGVKGLPFYAAELPIVFDPDWKRADYHLIGENMCEADREPDQPVMIDGLLAAAGFDPLRVAREHKLPLVPITPWDRMAATNWLQHRGLLAAKPLIVWQLAASTPIRSYPPEQTREALRLLCEAFPGGAVVVTGTTTQGEKYAPLHEAPNLHLRLGRRIRTYFALVERADLVIGPDTGVGHVAGGVGTPMVGLWASFDPRDRVPYYGQHHAIFSHVSCGPCRTHEHTKAAAGCPRAKPDESPYCRGLAGIAPDYIVEKAKENLACHL